MIGSANARPANRAKALVWLIWSEKRFIEAAVAHIVWLNSKDNKHWREAYRDKVPDEVLAEVQATEKARLASLRRQLGRSLLSSVLVASLAIVFGIRLGTVQPSWPLDFGRAVAFAGTLLVSWAALFELGGPGLPSFSDETLCERLHPVIFQFIFMPGALCLLSALVI